MNYIKVGDEWVNLDQVSAIQDRRDWDMGKSWSGSVTLESIGEDFVAYFKGDEAAALIAWLSVPAHMAGEIAPENRDVMAWYANWRELVELMEYLKVGDDFSWGGVKVWRVLDLAIREGMPMVKYNSEYPTWEVVTKNIQVVRNATAAD